MRTTPTPAAGPTRPRRRSRALHVAVPALVAVLVLAGCRSDNTPTQYNEIVKAAFTGTCVGNVAPTDSTTTTIATPQYCQCAYDTYVAMVPYNDEDKTNRDNGTTFATYSGKNFLDINKELGDDANKFNDNTVVPQNVRDALAACPKGETVAGPGTTVVGPAGTLVPGTAPEPVGPAPAGSTPPGSAA